MHTPSHLPIIVVTHVYKLIRTPTSALSGLLAHPCSRLLAWPLNSRTLTRRSHAQARSHAFSRYHSHVHSHIHSHALSTTHSRSHTLTRAHSYASFSPTLALTCTHRVLALSPICSNVHSSLARFYIHSPVLPATTPLARVCLLISPVPLPITHAVLFSRCPRCTKHSRTRIDTSLTAVHTWTYSKIAFPLSQEPLDQESAEVPQAPVPTSLPNAFPRYNTQL
ncbi:hypothetical protein BOTBODRAFT_178799 [Botryobasidium botryosum FD-172 SS1]|uniref:Uncharacterized protein n=1 Tax=Botryobasidium botryosum (strain FD-172 SS1) TaxID=930990 RepID=A0A067M4U8_BOTB1|nr:hypothetical protein BOTBODRAFT_178799 [Botryobasidium botryosum FD-172 SS1]